MRFLVPALAMFAAAVAASTSQSETADQAIKSDANPPQLSAFGFFEGSADKPSARIVPYALRNPLFSDYSEKQRFIYLPLGSTIKVEEDGKLVLPIGTALIKSFGYPDDSGKLRMLETRLLLHRASGWVALPYVWRADGSDADLRVGGRRLPVSFSHPSGKDMAISYAVPNKNQCKQCHSTSDAIMPIGPYAQNMLFLREGDSDKLGLNGMQAEAQWDNAKSGSLDARARAYLRVNCGHCHAPKGSASNSGLYLDGSAKDAAAYGIGKRPVAAGRASGDLDFIIDPGKPDRSILIARMKSTDPGIAMPELGRATVHEEGVRLLEQWVADMPTQ